MTKTSKKTNVTPLVKNDVSDNTFTTQILARLEKMEQSLENMFSSNWLQSNIGHNLSQYFGHKHELHIPKLFEGRTPKVDVIDKDKEVIVRAELPGIDKDNINVSMNDNMVTIKASAHSESKEEKDDYYYSEISSGSFSRTMQLPCAVDTNKYKAKFKNGLLELTLNKLEKARKKTIKID